MKERKTETIIVRVSTELKEALQKLAENERRKLSNYLRNILEDVVNASAQSSRND